MREGWGRTVYKVEWGKSFVLSFVTQAWKRTADVMIQILFIDGTYSRVKWSENKTIKKGHFSLTEEKRELLETILDVTFLCWKFAKWAVYMRHVHQIL